MKSWFNSFAILLASAASIAAADAALPDGTLIFGTWSLTDLSCSSGTPLSGGIKIGQDNLKITLNENHTFTQMATMAGCDIASKGTFKLEGSILSSTMTESQNCKDASPVPMNDSKIAFVAHLDQQRTVHIVTGADAAMLCPGGDALVLTYQREPATP